MTLESVEREWLAKLLARKAKLANDPKNKKREPKLCKVITKLCEKIATSGDKFTRNELRVMQKLVENHIATAINVVIPELMRRQSKRGNSSAKYKESIESVKKKVEMLHTLKAKIEGAI